MAIYKSEITLFLEKLKQDKPHLESAQKAGRSLLWDKEPTSPERQQELRDVAVAQKAYPYQTK
jgi:hypothetical protein